MVEDRKSGNRAGSHKREGLRDEVTVNNFVVLMVSEMYTIMKD